MDRRHFSGILATAPFLLPSPRYRALWQSLQDGRVLNVRTFGAKGDAQSDDSPAIQKAIDTAGPPGRRTESWATEPLGVVLFPPGDYLLGSPIRIPEGVLMAGASVYASRLIISNDNWTETTPKITDVPFDYAPTKNFGLTGLSILPDIRHPHVAPQGVAFLHFRSVTELILHNVRLLMHTFPFGGGPGPYIGIRLEECAAVDFDNVVFDSGDVAIESYKHGSHGLNLGRVRNCYFYRQREYALSLAESSRNLIVSTEIDFPVDRGGAGIGLRIDRASNENIVNGLVCKTVGHSSVDISGNRNSITAGMIQNSSPQGVGVNISGNDNLLSGNHVTSHGPPIVVHGTGNKYDGDNIFYPSI